MNSQQVDDEFRGSVLDPASEEPIFPGIALDPSTDQAFKAFGKGFLRSLHDVYLSGLEARLKFLERDRVERQWEPGAIVKFCELTLKRLDELEARIAALERKQR